MEKQNNVERTLQEILDSDNELPSDYEEVAELPAYKRDSRFDFTNPLNFPNKQSKIGEKCKTKYFKEAETENSISTKVSLIKKGILSKQDIVCLKNVGATFSEANFNWFVNFLIQKDMQSNYNFLTSCLVKEDTGDFRKKYKIDYGHVNVNDFNIIVKT